MKDIAGYEGLYAITENGEVWSYRRNKFMKLVEMCGYLYIGLWKDNKTKHFRVHRLVAEAFIPNPNGLAEVNHKDENKLNNCVDNLEWCDTKYNLSYGTRLKRISEAMKGNTNGNKPVRCIETNAVYPSAAIAAKETGANGNSIRACCKNERNTAGGYHWERA